MQYQHGKEVSPEMLGLTPDQMKFCVACGRPTKTCQCAEADGLEARAAAIHRSRAMVFNQENQHVGVQVNVDPSATTDILQMVVSECQNRMRPSSYGETVRDFARHLLEQIEDMRATRGGHVT